MRYDGRIASREPLMILPESALRKPKVREPRGTAVWRPMTPNEQTLARALWECCTFVPGTAQKRFARSIAAQAAAVDPQITDKQRRYLHIMVHRYRRQIPAEILMLRLDDAEAVVA